MKSNRITLLAAGLAASLSSLTAPAAERFWDGNDLTGNWNVPANWDGNGALNVAADDLNFPTGVGALDKVTSNNYALNTVFRTLNFLEGGYTVSGSIMGLTDGISCFFATGSVTMNASVSLQADQNFIVNGGGDLDFNGQIFVNDKTLRLQPFHADSNIRIDSVLSGANTGAIFVGKAGTVNINGAKAFTSNLTIEQGGTLVVNDAGSLGAGTGTTSITDGTLVIDNLLPVNLPESIKMTNVNPVQSTIRSEGGAHTLSGPIELSGGSFKNINVEGPSLTLSGPVSGNIAIGSVVTRGPGRLILSGAQTNTLDINIFRVWDGELFLNKTGGAQAISAPFLLAGRNGGNPDEAIIRLGASDQIDDDTQVNIMTEGWFDLNGKHETIRRLVFDNPGRVTTGGGGELRINNDVEAFSATQEGGTAVITGRVSLGAPDSEWEIYGGNIALNLRVDGSVTSLAPGGLLTKSGGGALTINGEVSVPLFKANDGTTTLNGTSMFTDLQVNGGTVQASGVLKKVACNTGKLIVGTDTANASLLTQDLHIGGTVSFTFTSNAPNGHDVINTAGEVNLANGALANFIPIGAVNIAIGEEVILINNGGSDPIIGSFDDDAVDHVVADEYWLSYTGGDGNDLSITRIVPPTNFVRTWDGGGNDDEWMTAANWNGNVAPKPGDALVFPEEPLKRDTHNNFPADTTFHSITVHGSANGKEYTIFGNRVRMNFGVSFMEGSASHFWGVPLIFSLPGTITSKSTGFIQMIGNIDNGGKTLTLRHTDATLDGDIYMSHVISGAGGIRKTGPGQFTFFEHANTYTGVTTIEEGVLAIKWNNALGAAGDASGTRVEAGATLLVRAEEEPISCNETITLAGTIDDNGGQAANLNGPLIVEGPDATLNTATITINGAVTGPGTLHKTGPGVLTLAGGAANTFSGGFMADGGETRLQKIGNDALAGPVIIGNGGVAAKVTLLTNNQIGNGTTVQIVHASGVLETGIYTETIGGLVMTGGAVQGSGAGQLTLSGGVIITQASASTAAITTRLAVPANVTGSFTVAEGGASPDLRLDGLLYGGTIEKKGAGRMDLTPAMGGGTLPDLSVLAGSALVQGQCPQLRIALKGGLIGGGGRVNNITASPSGTVSPGASPGLFSAAQLSWNATTTFRVELDGTDPGSQYDQLIADGTVNLGSAKLALTSGFNPAAGATFMIVRNVSGSPINGTFVNAPENGYVSAPGGKVFQITYQGGDGDDVVLTKIDAVPPEVVSFNVTPHQGKGGDENQIALVIKGMPGLTYQLESSTDLLQWKTLTDSVASLQNGQINFEVFEPETTKRLFFRARLP